MNDWSILEELIIHKKVETLEKMVQKTQNVACIGGYFKGKMLNKIA